jgi:hypothetical protein
MTSMREFPRIDTSQLKAEEGDDRRPTGHNCHNVDYRLTTRAAGE